MCHLILDSLKDCTSILLIDLRERERHWFASTYLLIHWSILVCSLTGYETCNLGVWRWRSNWYLARVHIRFERIKSVIDLFCNHHSIFKQKDFISGCLNAPRSSHVVGLVWMPGINLWCLQILALLKCELHHPLVALRTHLWDKVIGK